MVERYELLHSLSQGGMSDLFVARETTAVGVDRQVVIKRLRLKYNHDPGFVTMFLDEARLTLALEHPNIVRAYEAGTWDGSHYLALEYLRGADVGVMAAAAAARGDRLGLEPALAIVDGLAAALDYIHTRTAEDGTPLHIVHRDVSPGNVLVCLDGSVKLLDFGVATSRAHMSPTTEKGVLKGTFPYMSPEQCLGEDLGPRSDLFSLGGILYELTTGRRLFRGACAVDVVANVIESPVEPPSSLVADYPPDLEALVLRLLCKHPDGRPRSAEEVRRELEQVARRVGVSLASGPLARVARDLATEGVESDPTLPSSLRTEPRAQIVERTTVTLQPLRRPDVTPLTVLVVDDEEAVHRIVRARLTGYQRLDAYTAAQALDALASRQIDLVLLDLDLPDTSGFEVLDQVRRSGDDVVVIVVTGHSDVQTAVESMRRGAHDFMVKSHESWAGLGEHVGRALRDRGHARAR